MYGMYADMLKNSISGVEKIIYMPTDAINNPLSFFNLTAGIVPGFQGKKPVQPTQPKNDLD